MARQCGTCQLCCKLLPVPPLGKGAGQRCKFQRFNKGCAVYHKAGMPRECALWTCRWLVENDTAGLSRPDRSHYVLDIAPDYLTIRDNETGEAQHIQVVQIWVDPKHPDAHRDPALRAYLERRGRENIVGLVRWDNQRGMAIFPPAMSADRQWHEVTSDLHQEEHRVDDIAEKLGDDYVVMELQER
jgi:hypothetical protein